MPHWYSSYWMKPGNEAIYQECTPRPVYSRGIENAMWLHEKYWYPGIFIWWWISVYIAVLILGRVWLTRTLWYMHLHKLLSEPFLACDSEQSHCSQTGFSSLYLCLLRPDKLLNIYNTLGTVFQHSCKINDLVWPPPRYRLEVVWI